jgi:hypothetical protein
LRERFGIYPSCAVAFSGDARHRGHRHRVKAGSSSAYSA